MARADNDNFSGLPLFATDKEIAVAIVGKERASTWLRERFPTIAAKPGFPPVDAFHGGRPVPLVRMFYDVYFGAARVAPIKADNDERPEAWHKTKRKA